MHNSPIMVVEDDKDDCDLLMGVLKDLSINNEIRCFNSAAAALQYLRTTKEKTFLIISDINMPAMTGMEFKRQINKDEFLHQKAIPFIFLTTADDDYSIQQAYKLNIQGYFEKQTSFAHFESQIKLIVNYWKSARLKDY